MPEQHGAIEAGGVEHARQDVPGLPVHEVGREAGAARIGGAMAVPAVGEDVAPDRGGEPGGKVAPGGDAAQALVKQHDRRMPATGASARHQRASSRTPSTVRKDISAARD